MHNALITAKSNLDRTRVEELRAKNGALCVTSTLPTAFGELTTASPLPITQITAPYGILSKVEEFVLNSGTTTATDSLFSATTGTTAESQAALLTKRQVAYRAGQGALARVTALFDTPISDSNQLAGFISQTDQLGFGYENTIFGIIYNHHGESEIQELTITTPATGSENATITIDGVGYTVPLTSGTAQHNAYEAANSLNTQVTLFDFSSNDDQIVARSVLARTASTFAFTSSTAVAGWSQVQAGLSPTSDFVPQTEWNVDTRISSDADINLDPTKGNVYQVQMQYLGFGGINYFVEDKVSGEFILVHRVQFANTNILPLVGNPAFQVGWLVNNGTTNTTSLTIKGGSAAGFIEGFSIVTEPPRAEDNTHTTVPVGSFENILTLRNRLVLNTKHNWIETSVLSLTAATDSTKAAIMEVRRGATIAGDLDFSYIDKDTSIIEIATDPGVVTGGTLVASFVMPAGAGIVTDLTPLLSLILPGDTLTLAASITSGSVSAVTATLIWQEDI